MLWSAHALAAQTLLCFGHGCFGRVCSRNTNDIMVWAWMLWSAYAVGTRPLFWFGHGCFGQRVFSEHERYYGFGMDALVRVCCRNTNVIMVLASMLWSAYATGNTNVIMVWTWMLWSAYPLGTRLLLWFGHGCFGQCICCRNTNVILVWPWMLSSAYALGA